MVMKRFAYASALVLVTSAGLTGFVKGGAAAASFGLDYLSAYSNGGLSQPYGGATATGQSYDDGVAVSPSDPRQKVYTLVEASPPVGVGACRGCFPAGSRTRPEAPEPPSGT
jgi:hypothetical protein